MYERHGHTRSRHRSGTHQTWTNMVARCTNPNRPDYAYYGGRGITVCDRWRNSFAAFLADMGEKPVGTSLDRIDNALGYEPANCRWATKHEQMQNTRATRLISISGETMGLAAWCRRIGINTATFYVRLRHGWSIEEALSIPPNPRMQWRKGQAHGC